MLSPLKTVRLPSSAFTLGAGIVLLIALSLATATWLDVAAAKSRFDKQVENRGQIIVDSSAEFTRDAVYFRDIDRLDEAIKVIAAQPGVSFVDIFDGEGRLFASSNSLNVQGPARGVRQFERVIAPGGQTTGLIRVGLDDAALQAEFNSISRNRIWQGLILFVAGTALAAALGFVFATPLRRVAAAARRLEQGDLTTRISPAGTSETRALGAAFNRMADRIEKNERSLKQDQEKLEKRVSERTEEIRTIARIGRLFSSRPDIRNIFNEFGPQFRELVDHRSALLYEYRSKSDGLERVSSTGSVPAWPSRMQLPADWKGAPSERLEVARFTGQDEHDRLLGRVRPELASAHSVAVPLFSNRELIGVLFVSRTGAEFKDGEIDRCRRIGIQIAGALATSLLYERNMEMAIERQRSLEEERTRLKAADRAKNEFLSSLSHELRTPLVAILGYTSILSRKLSVSVNDDEMEMLRTIERNGKRLNAQIEDLLDLSRIQRRQLDISPERVEWRSFLADLELSMKPLLDTSGHQLAMDVRHDDVWVNIDSARMNQVVSNLINNAAKYSPGADRVDLVSEVLSGEVVLSVKDYGVGIKPADQKHLFTLFYRTQDAIASAAPGTGIGLFVSRKIIDMHGGELTIESKYGEGSTAKLTLASVADDPAAVERPSSSGFKNRLEDIPA